MMPPQKLFHPATAIDILAALGLTLRVRLVSHSPDTFIQQHLSDDAFYYFALVKNIVEGQGVVFKP